MIRVFISYQRRSRRFKFSTDKDCLSADIDYFHEREVEDLDVLKKASKILEACGFTVCIDFEDYFYETPRDGFTVEPYGNRFWAVYTGDELVCVCLYKKGATEVKRRLAIAEAKPRNSAFRSQNMSEPSAPQGKNNQSRKEEESV